MDVSVEEQNFLLPFKALLFLFLFLMGILMVCAVKIHTIMHVPFFPLLSQSWAQAPPVYQLHWKLHWSCMELSGVNWFLGNILAQLPISRFRIKRKSVVASANEDRPSWGSSLWSLLGGSSQGIGWLWKSGLINHLQLKLSTEKISSHLYPLLTMKII